MDDANILTFVLGFIVGAVLILAALAVAEKA